MKGYFVVDANKSEKFDIKCELHPDYAKDEVPVDQQTLYTEIESANNIIKSLHNTDDTIKSKYFNKLLSLSQAGLVGETAQPNLAMKSLEKLKNEITLIEGQRIKNDYMKKLGIKALILGIIALAIYFISKCFLVTQPFSMYCISFVGALLGTWISFGARKFLISFEQLSSLEEDMMSPWIRLLYIGLCAIIFMLFLNTKIVSIAMGEISTLEIKSSPEMQMSVGVLCGLVESRIGISIYKKAVRIVDTTSSI